MPEPFGTSDDDGLEPLPPSLRRTWGDTTTMADRPKRSGDGVVMHGPGPEERKLRNRLIFRLTGRWPKIVVAERLLLLGDARRRALDRLFFDA